MLAGTIVQVRPERKALSAAVSPTCCSGREQRSKTAHAGSAIPLKRELRKAMRKARRALSAAEHRRRSRLAALHAMQAPGFAAGKRIAAYKPFDRETDTSFLIEAGRARGVEFYLPVITHKERASMVFLPYSDTLRRGHFGI